MLVALRWSVDDEGLRTRFNPQRQAGEHWRRAFGLYAFTASLGIAIGPLLGRWLYDQAGQATPSYTNFLL